MSNVNSLAEDLDEISGGKFVENRDILIVEGWLKNKAALCAHIEILDGQDPIVCAGWQQIIGVVGSYSPDFLIMADTWDEAFQIVQKVIVIFH